MSGTRKLAAILVTDVVGFSRLAGADEQRTLARLRALRGDLVDPAVAAHLEPPLDLFVDDLPNMDADAKLDPPFRRHPRVALDETVLHFNGAAHRIDHAAEFDDRTVA